jgi:hypothetical protein
MDATDFRASPDVQSGHAGAHPAPGKRRQVSKDKVVSITQKELKLKSEDSGSDVIKERLAE